MNGAFGAIGANGATGSIGAIRSPNDPLTLNGDCEISIAIEWIKWRHLNGANGRYWRQWMSPLSPMAIVIANGATYRIAIGANGAFIGATHCRHCRQSRQMFHSPNFMTLLPIIPYIRSRSILSQNQLLHLDTCFAKHAMMLMNFL